MKISLDVLHSNVSSIFSDLTKTELSKQPQWGKNNCWFMQTIFLNKWSCMKVLPDVFHWNVTSIFSVFAKTELSRLGPCIFFF